MRVIKEGQVPPESIYQGECYHCKCVYEYIKPDIKFDLSKYIPFYTVCPCCGQQGFHDEKYKVN